jgi:hypothetical protein
MGADVESARRDWRDADRRLEEEARDGREAELRRQIEIVLAELRRRVGGMFTLQELADEYAGSDAWVRSALAEAAAPGWPRTLSVVEGAAFHAYSRGAQDYEP